jgi:hypothetical protein
MLRNNKHGNLLFLKKYGEGSQGIANNPHIFLVKWKLMKVSLALVVLTADKGEEH